MGKGGMIMSIKKLIKDVKGSGLVYVIIAAALIIMLGAATTVTAYVNLRATQIQEKSDNNFYNADSVMNAIVSGLESDISKVYEAAYTQVITKLDTYERQYKDAIAKGEATKSVQEIATSEFNMAFLNAVNDMYEDKSNTIGHFYNINKLHEYAQKVLKNDISYTISAVNGKNYLDVNDDCVVLRNVHITYENDNGYYDEITTDVKISIPEFNPDMIEDAAINLNAFVVDDGLEISYQRGLQINGNAYINERESDHSAILLKDYTSLAITTPKEIIAGGLIKTGDNTFLSLKGLADTEEKGIIWTENFDFGRYTTAELVGYVFVYDDLEINGSYADIKISGEYYGYSKSNTDAKQSSSININGAHAKLDIQKLDKLVLAGSSYISTSTVISGNNKYSNSTDIQLGEAFSVKSNQIAYLVDDNEFKNDKNGILFFASNPMSYTQYNTLCNTNGNNDNSDGTNEEDTLKKIQEATLSYGKSYKDYGAEILPVFSNKDNGTVYLYLNFKNPDDASRYFVDAYKGDTLLSQRLRTYAAQYIQSLKLNITTMLLVNQNYINSLVELYSEETLPNIEDGLKYDKEEVDKDALNTILNTTHNLYFGDETDPNSVGEKYKVTYSKLINQQQLESFITQATFADDNTFSFTDANTNNKITVIDDGVILNGTSGAQAIIVNNKDGDPYTLGSGQGIAIISGDVIITGDWLGTIIVGGRAYCQGGSKDAPIDITIDNNVVSSVLPLYFTTKSGNVINSMSVVNIFNGYENLKVNNATNSEGINKDMISNCISFTNWNRY